MKTNKTKKLEFKKTNIVELNSDKLKTIVGGSDTQLEIVTDPRSVFTSRICKQLSYGAQ